MAQLLGEISAYTRVRSSEFKTKLVSPFTVAGRVRPTQHRRPQPVQASFAVVERLHVAEAKNSIVPAPTLGCVRPIEEVSAA
jgi:hypothetical protein